MLEQKNSTVNNVAVIGAGQLGSRHLQGLTGISNSCRITVVDPSQESLERAKARFAECPANELIRSIDFVTSVEALPVEIDFAIVATNSLCRRKLVEDILAHSKVKYMILEKFLFPRVDDYAAVAELLKAKGVTAFVNCPRRMFAYYTRIAELLKDQQILNIRVSGSNWGMGCNAIHFLDIITWLLKSTDFELANNLDQAVLPSKREGYIEFTGEISGHFANGCNFAIASYAAGKAPILIEIQAEETNIVLSESTGKMMISSAADNWSWKEEAATIRFQSALSGIVADDCLQKGSCELAPFDWSAECHLKLLKLFLEHMNNINPKGDKDLCPIT